MKKSIKIFNTIMLALILLADIIYILMGQGVIPCTSITHLIAKSITSGLFVLTGIVNLIYAIRHKTGYIKFSVVLFIGLIFAMLGDILLEIEFIVGAGLFAVGHIFFFISYNCIFRFRARDIIYGLAIFLPSLIVILFVPVLDYGGDLMLIVCTIYAYIISLMLGKALSNVIALGTSLTMIVLVGSILFFISDLMLLFNVFGGVPLTGIFCLVTYYPAEFILAFSIALASKNSYYNK